MPRRMVTAGVVALMLAVVVTDGWALWSQPAVQPSQSPEAPAAQSAAAAHAPAAATEDDADQRKVVAAAPAADVAPTAAAADEPAKSLAALPGAVVLVTPNPQALAQATSEAVEPAPSVETASPGADQAEALTHVSGAEPALATASAGSLNPPAAATLSTELPMEAADPAAQASIDVEVAGRGAWLILDGHGIGHIHHQLLNVSAGRHRIVLVRAGRTLRRWLMLQPGQQRSWHVD